MERFVEEFLTNWRHTMWMVWKTKNCFCWTNNQIKIKGAGTKPKYFNYMENFDQYEAETRKQLGIDDNIGTGLYSVCKDSDFMPFLCGVENLPQNSHYFMSFVEGNSFSGNFSQSSSITCSKKKKRALYFDDGYPGSKDVAVADHWRTNQRIKGLRIFERDQRSFL